MTKLRLSDIKNVLEEDLPYSTIVDYLRFLHTFGRGTKVSALDQDLHVALKVENASYASQKLATLYQYELVRRDKDSQSWSGRKPFLYYVPK